MGLILPTHTPPLPSWGGSILHVIPSTAAREDAFDQPSNAIFEARLRYVEEMQPITIFEVFAVQPATPQSLLQGRPPNRAQDSRLYLSGLGSNLAHSQTRSLVVHPPQSETCNPHRARMWPAPFEHRF